MITTIIDQEDTCNACSTYKCSVLCRLVFPCYISLHLRKDAILYSWISLCSLSQPTAKAAGYDMKFTLGQKLWYLPGRIDWLWIYIKNYEKFLIPA